MAALRNLFRRSHKTISVSNAPFVVVLGSDGQLYGLKYTSEALEMLGVSGNTSSSALAANDEGYAVAYVASDWVFRCLNLRASKTAELLHGAMLRDNATDAVIINHPYLDAIERAYRDYHQDIYFEYVLQRDIFGEAFIEKIQGSSPHFSALRVPYGLRVLPSLAVEPEIREGKIESFFYTSEDENVRLPPDAVAYDYVYNPFNNLRGLSLLAGALNSVNLELYIIRHNTVYFQNGARPSLVISPKQGETFTDSDYETVRDWLNKYKGVANFFKPLPLSRPVDITTVEYPTLEDQKYLTDDQRAHICARTGVPLGLVSFESQTYQLSPEQRIAFHENTIIPLAKACCKFINTKVLPFFDTSRSVHLELDSKELAALVEDEVQMDEMIRSRYLNGQITHNEMRQALRMHTADVDFYVLPIGHRMVPVDQLSNVMIEQAQPVGAQPLVQTPALLGDGEQPAPETERRRNEYHPPILPSFTMPSGNGGNGFGRSLSDSEPDMQLSPERELRAWRRVALRKGRCKALDFVPHILPAQFSETLRMNIAIAPDDKDRLAELFQRAGVWLSAEEDEPYQYDEGKAIQATRLEFENAFEDAFKEAMAGGIDRRRWSTIVRSLLRRWGSQAYRDGLHDGGVEGDALSADDQAAISSLLAEQSAYVTDLGERIFSEEGISVGETIHKAEMWFNKSVLPFYHAGRLSADKNGMYMWQLGPTEEHCISCETAHGQRHRLRDWHALGIIPQSDLLECRGFNCQCQLVRSDGAPLGDLASIPLLAAEEVGA